MDMKHFFGKITNDEMTLSNCGKVVEEQWLKTGLIRRYVLLDQYRIMPNHFHGILMLTKDFDNSLAKNETTRRVVSTGSSVSLKSGSLGSIVGQFKSKCTKEIRLKFSPLFQWQGRFHDRIIRDEKELNAIREYIFYNPLNWRTDKFFG